MTRTCRLSLAALVTSLSWHEEILAVGGIAGMRGNDIGDFG